MEHMIISVRNLQAFNMAAVLTDKNKQTNKQKTPKTTTTMISVSCPQAFNMVAVLTDKKQTNNKTKKQKHAKTR